MHTVLEVFATIVALLFWGFGIIGACFVIPGLFIDVIVRPVRQRCSRRG